MKKLIILLLLPFSMLSAQDSEPTPWNFVWGFSPTERVFDPDSFALDRMFTGFQWGSSWQMNNALMNTGAELNNYVAASGTVNTPNYLDYSSLR